MKFKYKSFIILIISIILGTVTGIVFKENVSFLVPFKEIFLNLLFTLVVPLIFFTVTSTIANVPSLKKLNTVLKKVFIVFFITSLISALYMFVILKVSGPMSNNIKLSESNLDPISLGSQIVKMITVTDFTNLFSKSNIMPLIIFSFILGIAISKVGSKDIKEKLNNLSLIFMKMVKIVMLYAPIGLFAYFAVTVSEYGSIVTKDFLKVTIIYFVSAFIYMFIFYTIYAYISKGKKGVYSFWKNSLPSILTSLGTQSSLATLPVNMDTADNMKLSENSKVTLSLGSTMHMEGSSMAAMLKIMFVFSILNIQFTIPNILLALLISVLSAVVMAGIPGGGLIGESLIISLYGFPIETFLIISTIGILVDAPATMLNAVGDITSAMLVDKLE